MNRPNTTAAYERFKAHCLDLSSLYDETPGEGFKLGHYDDERQACVFYDIHLDELLPLKASLDALGIRYCWLTRRVGSLSYNVSCLDIDV